MKNLPFELIYVSPFDQHEIDFTEGTIVPVLSIGEEWKLDSTPIIEWLDERFPETNLCGTTDEEKSRIAAIDDWVSNRWIPAFFRHCIDSKENIVGMFHVGYKLASTMNKTYGGLPVFLYPVWPFLLRIRSPFIKREAEKVAEFKTCTEGDKTTLAELESHLAGNPFLGRKSAPSLADVALYAQVYCALALRFKGVLDVRTSPVAHQWIRNVENALPDTSLPELYPGMPQDVAA